MQIEWGVMRSRTGELWEGPMTEQQARAWVYEAEEVDGFKRGSFVVCRRPVGRWTPAPKEG